MNFAIQKPFSNFVMQTTKVMAKVKEIIINSPKYGQKIILIDSEDYKLILKYKWIVEKGRTTFYAMAHVGSWKKRETIRMHQLILGIIPEKNGKRAIKVDHKNHNGLDNTRINIRTCTNEQNGFNQQLSKRNSTGYKGVIIKIDKRRGRNSIKYNARIRVNGKLIDLGRHSTPLEAAIKYNEAALKFHGDFAYLNPINQ